MRFGRAWSSAHQAEGRKLAEMGRYTEAIAEYHRALGISEKMLAPDGNRSVIERDAFQIELDLTRALAISGDRATALETVHGAAARAAPLGRAARAEANLALAEVYHKFGDCERVTELTRAMQQEIERIGPQVEYDSPAGTIRRARALAATCTASTQK